MRRGFTLIELLVVIAIIAILAAILFPVFITAKEKGRQASCLNNMGQLGKAFRMYVDDWKRYPGVAALEHLYWYGNSGVSAYGGWVGFEGYWNGTSENPTTWAMSPSKGALWPYTKNRQLYVCPSDEHARKITYKNARNGMEYRFDLSYAMNWSLNLYPPPTGAYRCPDSGVVTPTKTVLLVDVGAGWYNITPNGMKGRTEPVITPQSDGCYRYWQAVPTVAHCGGCNFSFCDGHAKWIDWNKFADMIYRTDGLPSPDGKY